MEIDTDSFCSRMFTLKPIHPTRMYYIDREQSFEHWQLQKAQKPSFFLFKMDFFYTGIGGKVTYFYCDVTLKQWESTDCIETEHLKWEPNCLFAKMVSSKVAFFYIFSK
jgi:hypothetical protein